jgi:hypothetical protein
MHLLQFSAAVHPASGVTSLAWLLVALPLLGAAILLFGGRRTDRFGPALATGLSWTGFGSVPSHCSCTGGFPRGAFRSTQTC